MQIEKIVVMNQTFYYYNLQQLAPNQMLFRKFKY